MSTLLQPGIVGGETKNHGSMNRRTVVKDVDLKSASTSSVKSTKSTSNKNSTNVLTNDINSLKVKRHKVLVPQPPNNFKSRVTAGGASGRGNGLPYVSKPRSAQHIQSGKAKFVKQKKDFDLNLDLDYDQDEQDITFTNIEGDSISNDKLGSATSRKENKLIVPNELLEAAQETDVKKVFEIILHGDGISKISNIDKFIRCRILDLSCNHIERIENIETLNELRELKLYGNKIEEICNLDNSKELTVLQLQHNRIGSIGKGLNNQRKLKQLRLDNNLLTKIDPRELAGCASVISLDISNNNLDSLSALNCLPNLEELIASNNRLKTVPDLGRCKKLQEVNFSGNKLTDISGLKNLASLSTIDVSNNNIYNLKSVGKLRYLLELNISHNRLIELESFVQQFQNIEVFDISVNKIETWKEVDKLKELSSLVELTIHGNPVTERQDCNHHQELQVLFPGLSILDGIHVKKSIAKSSAPLMRPMSASAVVSSRQVESQLKQITGELLSFEADAMKRFDSLRATVETLPTESPSRPQTAESQQSSRPSSRARSRISKAMEFAADNF